MSLKTRNAIVTGSTSGIGLAIARAFAKEGANVTINGFGDAAAIEAERAGIEKEFGVKARYSPGRHDEARSNSRDGDGRGKGFRQRRRSRQQRRDPACRADRGVSDRHLEPHHRHQSLRRLPRHRRRDPRHEGAQMGPHHLDRLGPFEGRFAVQIRLCHGQARHRRADQDGGAGDRQIRDHRELHLARLCLDPARREADPRHHGGAPSDARAGHQRRAAARRSRPRNSSPSTRWRRSRCSSPATRRSTITGANYSIDGGWTAE